MFLTALKWLIGAIIAWIAFVVVLVTPAVNILLDDQVSDATGLEFTSALLLVDPLDLEITLQDASLRTASGVPLAHVDELNINVAAASSLATQKLLISKIEIDAPRYTAPDGAYNLALPDITARASMEMTQPGSIKIAVHDLALRSLKLLPTRAMPAAEHTFIKLEQLIVDTIEFTTDNNRLSVNQPSISGLSVSSTEAEGNLSLIDMLMGSQPPTPETSDDPMETWSVLISDLDLARSDITLLSPLFKHGMLALENLSVSLDTLQWPDGPDSHVTVSAVANQHATIAVEISGNVPAGELVVATILKGLRLSETEPVFAEDFNIELDGGSTELDVQLALSNYLPESLTGRLFVHDFDAHLRDTKNNLLAFEQFRVEGIDINLTNRSVAIAEAHLTGAKGNLLIREDGTINATRVQTLSAEVSQEAEALAEESDAQEQDVPEEWSIKLPGIFVYDSELTFRDESLPVRFTTVIGDLNAEITGFDTSLDSSMKIAGHGSIDGYAPVIIEGDIGHFSAPENGFLKFEMSGVDIARLTPYSTTFLGYPIERGVLGTELDYILAGGKLKGNNHVIVERLKLGKRTDNQSVLDVPIETAVALLTDASGVIDLELGVRGDVDDPEFQIFDAIWSAAGNLIGNILTAPFKLLASLAGEEDVDDTVRFGAGTAKLDEPAQRQLETVAAGLAQRPQLALVLQPRINRETDSRKLRRNVFEQSLEANGLSREDIDRKSEAWELTLRTLATEAGLDPALTVVEARNQLIGATQLADGALAALALERAVEVKRYLVMQGNLDPQRATVAPWDPDSENISGVALDIDTR